MQVLHIISNKDNSGGTIAALNLHYALLNNGIRSAVLSSGELEGFEQGKGYRRFGGIIGRVQQGFLNLENLFAKPGWINPVDKFVVPDILGNYSGVVHIHVTHVAQISFDLIGQLAEDNKILWTLHDLWPLTGKCIHPIECSKYLTNCHQCPRLLEYPKLKWDNTAYLHQQKKNFITQHKIHFIAPSKWIKNENEAYLNNLNGKISTIPHALNSNFQKALISKEEIRRKYNLPIDGDVILFPQGRWDDEKKGGNWFESIKHALAIRINLNRKIYLIKLSGNELQFNKLNNWVTEVHLPVTSNQEVMAAYYQLSDVSISLSQIETFGLCVAESLACGVPVLARSAKGINELLTDDVIANSKDELTNFILSQKWLKINYKPLFSRIANDMNINNWAKAHIALYDS